jgi:hypothetical protein
MVLRLTVERAEADRSGLMGRRCWFGLSFPAARFRGLGSTSVTDAVRASEEIQVWRDKECAP